MGSTKTFAPFQRQHGASSALIGGGAVTLFAAGAYFYSLKVELAKERELWVKELEIRDKEILKERELREKDAIIARKASSEAELRALRLFFDVKNHEDYESLQKRLRQYESSLPETS
ncbi:hypothetical protein BKA69DRAFT_1120877 [Paraphysoderma sedebokerense]|nr:hypothetical protein BKA69DRAFT_1120877 [Paraphysoderma sedebokerense]